VADYREIYTWTEYHKNDDELKDIDWDELVKLVNLIRKFQELIPPDYRERIEEKPPTIIGDTFNPQGWVGTYIIGEYRLRVIPKPELMSIDQFEEIMNELVGWLEFIGPFLEDFLKFCSYEPIFKFLLCESYSRRLTEYTEIILSHFIPRDILSHEHVGSELRGRPLWKKTLSLKARGTHLLACNKVEFSFRTLPNLLLTRFHTDLLRDMKNLMNTLIFEEGFPEILQDWKIYTFYHEDFINSHLWSDLLEESWKINFESSEVLEKTRHAARGVWNEIIDLWEAYKAKKAFFFGFEDRFDNAIKPLSKVYELWCFKKLCDIFGIDRKNITEFPCKIRFEYAGKHLRFYYNTNKGLKKYSGIMREIPVSLGVPDFVIENEEKIACIMDAKCKDELTTDDMQRFLAYIFDYMYPHNERLTGIVFYVSKESKIKKIKAKDAEIYLVPMTLSSYPHIKDEVESIIRSTLS